MLSRLVGIGPSDCRQSFSNCGITSIGVSNMTHAIDTVLLFHSGGSMACSTTTSGTWRQSNAMLLLSRGVCSRRQQWKQQQQQLHGGQQDCMRAIVKDAARKGCLQCSKDIEGDDRHGRVTKSWCCAAPGRENNIALKPDPRSPRVTCLRTHNSRCC